MVDTSTTTAILDQAEEDILAYTASDEALESAAGIEGTPPLVLQNDWLLLRKMSCPTP